jgi:lia operon protein LiaG
MQKFKTAFVVGIMVTVCAWTMAFVFSAIAGETPKGSLKKVEAKLNSKQKNISERREVQLAGIETIHVGTGSKDIRVVSTDGDQLVVEYRGRSSVEQPLEIVTEGNVLKVGLKKEMENSMQWQLSFDDDDEEENKAMGLYVSVPKSYAKNIEVEGGSSDIRASSLNVGSLVVKTGSGDIDLTDSRLGKSELKTGSGDVEATRTSGELVIAVASGDIEVEEFQGELLKVAAASGDISLEKFTAKSVIGSAASGDILVKLADAQGWRFDLSSASGDISNTLSQDANGDKTLRLSTASGDISIKQ